MEKKEEEEKAYLPKQIKAKFSIALNIKQIFVLV